MRDGHQPHVRYDRILLFLLVNLVVGVGVPALVDALTAVNLDVFQQVALGLLIASALSLAEIITRLEAIYQLRMAEWEVWTERAKIDIALGDIRRGLHELVADDSLRDSFYLDHYQRELDLLRSRVQSTIMSSEITLDHRHIDSTYVLLSIYDDSRHNSFRATHVCEDTGDFFDVTYQVWYHAWIERLESGKVKCLRRLFVYESEDELHTESNMKLLAFHNSGVRGLEGKIISRDEVLRFKSDYHIVDGVLDFGIFSNSYIYLGQTRKGVDIRGRYSREHGLIETYTNVFDGLWKSTLAEPVTNYVTERISIQDLFNKNFKLPPPSARAPAT